MSLFLKLEKEINFHFLLLSGVWIDAVHVGSHPYPDITFLSLFCLKNQEHKITLTYKG